MIAEAQAVLAYPKYAKKARSLIRANTYERSEYEDRDVLERIIFPHVLAYWNPKAILDIGRQDYCKFYNKFFKGRELWTIDKDPKMEEFGADNHIVGSVVDLKKHFSNNKFDFILMNGVFGWGLNRKGEIEKAISAIYDIMKPGGLFVFGWNDVPDLVPVPLSKIEALKKFKKFYFEPLKSDSFRCKNGKHTYNFYIKR